MGFLSNRLNQKVSHWPKSGTLDNYGQPIWDAPVLLDGRWEEVSEQILTVEGKTILSRATVYLAVDVAIGDYLMLGEFASGNLDPQILSGTFEVKDFRKIPQLRGSDFERTARL